MKVFLNKHDCLIIVDVQNDFCPGGALAVKNGDAVVPVINGLVKGFAFCIATKDWHPAGSSHFKSWPAHCVAKTRGADLHPGLDAEKISRIFLKGTEDGQDGYSAFDATSANLERYLRSHEIERVFICGLATDFCVKETALSSIRAGFATFVIKDACRAVDLNEGDGERALRLVEDSGGKVMFASDLYY